MRFLSVQMSLLLLYSESLTTDDKVEFDRVLKLSNVLPVTAVTTIKRLNLSFGVESLKSCRNSI